MRRFLHVAAACLLLTLTACTSEGSERAVPQATPAPAPASPVSVPGEGSEPEEHVLYAYHLLRIYYVDEVEAQPLLEAAWEGALEAARRHFEPPAGFRPVLWPDEKASEAGLRGALGGLIDLAPGTEAAEAIVQEAISSMADSLDDNHTYYMRPKAYDLYRNNAVISLGYSGVRSGGGYLVWYVYEDGPAAKAGLRPGDVIVAVDGEQAADDREESERRAFEDGVSVRLTVDRPGAGVFEATATPVLSQRRIIDWRLIGEAAYVRLYRFPPPTHLMADGSTFAAHLERVFSEASAAGARSFVLDLRNNPGGSENVATLIAGRFGLSGPVVENRRRTGEPAVLKAQGTSGVGEMPLAVLINRNSASSSELVASSLHQAGVARLFGEKSAGIVNTSRTWSVAGGGLFITTERAYAGAGRLYLDETGVAPDEAVTLGRLELARGRDTQLESALDWLRSRTGAAAGAR
jgi:carboxyl-terminal processing protease